MLRVLLTTLLLAVMQGWFTILNAFTPCGL
jgi:hypothetical protein